MTENQTGHVTGTLERFTREEAEARLRHEVADWIARAMTSVAA